jgi:hypothetical protein
VLRECHAEEAERIFRVREPALRDLLLEVCRERMRLLACTEDSACHRPGRARLLVRRHGSCA